MSGLAVMHRIVFLHYLGGSAEEWRGVIDALPPGYETVTVDLPGFGQHAATSGYDVASMAAHVAVILGPGPHPPWTLVGHSMGAKVASVLARRALDGDKGLAGLAALVLVAGSPPAPEPMTDAKRDEMLGWFAGDAARSRREAERFVEVNVGRPLPAHAREGAVRDVLRTRRDAWRAWLTDGSREDWRERIGRIPLPTLLVAGSEDDALGPDAQRDLMGPHFPDHRMEIVQGSGHLIPLEHPASLAQLITTQVSSVAPLLSGAFGALLRSPRVSAGTRTVLLDRLVPSPVPTGGLPVALMTSLRAVMARLVPQDGPEPIDLGGRFVDTLAEAEGDGWRYAALPDDRTAALRGLRTLDAAARERGAESFAGLSEAEQNAVLGSAMEGSLKVSGEAGLLAADGLRLWMEDMRAAATRLYVAHPATLARLGYSGIANGGDGSPKLARQLIREGERDAWEPEPVR